MRLKIVHIRPNGTHEEVATVETTNEMRFIVDSPRYMGTWLSNDRKLLRYGLGEVRVYSVDFPAVIYDFTIPDDDNWEDIIPEVIVEDDEPIEDSWEDKQPEVCISDKKVQNDGQITCTLFIENHDAIGWIVLTERTITVHDKDVGEVLMVAHDFSSLAVTFEKEIAYMCMVSYEEFIDTYNLEGAL